jgi:nicotinamidase-related amidase
MIPAEQKMNTQGGWIVKRALVVIDVQNDYFSGAHTITHPEGSYGQILRAMDVAREKGVPVALVQHVAPESALGGFKKGTSGGEITKEVRERSHEVVIEKNLPGSFTGTNLEAWLRERGIDTVVIAGYMTQMCCDTTARQALHLGFQVEFLSDATGTHAFSNAAGSVSAEELHRAALVTMAMRFARVMTVGEWEKGLGA